MDGDWYYTVNGQAAPATISTAKLRQMLSSGQISPTDMVWKEGMSGWVPAGTIKGLLGELEGNSRSKSRKRSRTSDDPTPQEQPSSGLLHLHPILVLVLSACTLGLFALVYVWSVCRDYSRRMRREEKVGGRPLGKLQHPLSVLLLSYLTLGIYWHYWVYRTMKECSEYTGRNDLNLRVEFSLILIVPLYAVYVSVYRLPDLIRSAQQNAKLQGGTSALDHAYLFLLPVLFPVLPLLSMAQQEALNQVWNQG